jgi:hypothetical protein
MQGGVKFGPSQSGDILSAMEILLKNKKRTERTSKTRSEKMKKRNIASDRK